MSGTLTSIQQKEIKFELGPWLIGSCLDLILQGALSSQFVNYTWYNDKKPLKIIVGVLALLTLLKSIQAFVIIWIMFIVHFGDLNGATLLNYVTWWQAGNPAHIPEGCAPSNCRSIQFDVPPQRIQLTNERLGLISGLIRLTFQTAAPAAFCAMFNLIFSQISVTAVHSIVSTAFNMPLPKLYAVSMMWTLNARRAITAYHSSEHGMTGTSNEILGGRSRAQHRNNACFENYLPPHLCVSGVN